MKPQSWTTVAERFRAIAVIRSSDKNLGDKMAQAVAMGGFRLIEVTWNSDRAAELVQHLRSTLPHCLIGAGTLLTVEALQQAIAAGAEFLFTPHADAGLIHAALEQGIPITAGALSPTEIVQAWQAGASSVKVFPVQALGGAAYIQSLQGPLGSIPLIPTGGVTLSNAQAFLEAGAIAVGLSGDLFPASAMQHRDWDAIAHRAQQFIQSLSCSRCDAQGLD